MKTQKNFEIKKYIYIEILRITNYYSSIEKINNELGYYFFFFLNKRFSVSRVAKWGAEGSTILPHYTLSWILIPLRYVMKYNKSPL